MQEASFSSTGDVGLGLNEWATSEVAAYMYYTGIDPFSKQEVCVARNLRDRKLQRALFVVVEDLDGFDAHRTSRVPRGEADPGEVQHREWTAPPLLNRIE